MQSVRSHVCYLIDEKTNKNNLLNQQNLQRGNIVWIDFGFNVGHEFGGKHPALILRNINSGEDVYVIPLDSGKLPSNARRRDGSLKGGFVEIPSKDNGKPVIFNMKNIDRWCNVYRLRCISAIRIDTKSTTGWMRKDYVYKIEKATEQFRYKPLRNNLTK